MAITAAAGYGKTTALTGALSASGRPWAWCSCDGLTDGSSLLRHVAAALGERVPGFPRRLPLMGSAQEQVALLCNAALLGISTEIVLGVDDVDRLAGTGVSALGLLVAQLPANVHLALASRAKLPLSLSRLRTSGLVELDEHDLAFSESEAEDLLRGHGLHLTDGELADLHARTEGWVTGLLLAGGTAGGSESSRGPLFQYLADEVFRPLPSRARSALLATCVLDRLTPGLVAAATGRSDAADLLGSLVDRHVFVAPVPGSASAYRYREPFRAFLLEALEAQELSLGDVHRRAGAALSASGDDGMAVDHYLAAGDRDAARAALVRVAEPMVTSCGAGRLARWLEELSPDAGEDEGIALARASVLADGRSYELVCTSLEAALERFLRCGDEPRAALALCRLIAAAELAGGRWKRTIDIGHRALAALSSTGPLALDARVRLAVLYVPAGDLEGADRELTAVEGAVSGASRSLQVWARLVRVFAIDHPLGRSESALATMERCIEELGADGDEDPLARLTWAHAYRGLVLSDLGRHEEAIAEAGRLEAVGEHQGLGRAARTWAAWLRLGALSGQGRWAELELELRRDGPLFAGGSRELRAHRYHVAAAQLAARHEDAPAVAREVEEARPRLRAFAHALEEALVLSDLALAASHAGLRDLAAGLADEARARADVSRAPLGLARAMLVAGAVRSGPEEGGELAGAHRVPDILRFAVLSSERERRLAEGLLARAIAASPAPEGQAAAPKRAAKAAKHAPTAMRYETLGRFAVWRQDRPLPGSHFSRQKARMLLAALLSADGPVHREELLEWLWPELAPQKGMGALRTNLSALRHALEPTLDRGGVSSHVVSEGESYRLVMGPDDRWDAAEFLAAVKESLRMQDAAAVPRLEAAVDAYGGPFLPEWPYAEWTMRRRGELEQAYRDALERLAETLGRMGDLQASIGRYRRLLGLEPEREAWHRALMGVYMRAGERGLALRQYHICRQQLNCELGVEPSRETRELYSTLLR